ncbi:hypothetical protein H5410_054713 [Solanum commersonii]|uniref:Uncharacterized protein n=1 Tax=Solanum commersonii TaxID=4109 RepID=A0A9J5WFN9_SOLCO|nr:hypothetical protein H5410_054713 [Solanum commersonii]
MSGVRIPPRPQPAQKGTRLGKNSRASISSITKKPSLSLISLLEAIVTSRRIDDCIKDAVLVHLRLLNWLVVNSPRGYGTKDYLGPRPRVQFRSQPMTNMSSKLPSVTPELLHSGSLTCLISEEPQSNLVSLCMEIINSSLWWDSIMDFTTFSIGPFLSLPSPKLVMEEGIEKKAEYPHPFLLRNRKKPQKEERVESEEERDVEIEIASK